MRFGLSEAHSRGHLCCRPDRIRSGNRRQHHPLRKASELGKAQLARPGSLFDRFLRGVSLAPLSANTT